MLTDNKMFFIKEQVQFLKLAGTYDIFDPESNMQIGVAKEENSVLIKILRLFVSKLMLPNQVNAYNNQSQSLEFYIKKPFSFLRSNVGIYDSDNRYLGYFKSKIFSLGGGFYVFDPNNNQIAEIKGDWKGWNFSFLDNTGNQIGSVTKKWSGIGKELFTSADNYMISISDASIFGKDTVKLLLAAGLAIDTVFKEKG